MAIIALDDHDQEKVDIVEGAAASLRRGIQHLGCVSSQEGRIFSEGAEIHLHQRISPQGAFEVDIPGDRFRLRVDEDVPIPQIPMHQAGRLHLIQAVEARR